jgi:hypothetical protein
MTFQLIHENNIPKFAVFPFGDWEALEDYADELWAEQAIEKYRNGLPQKTYTLDEVEAMFNNRPVR